MKFMLLVYTDSSLLDGLPDHQMDGMLRTCFDHVDELNREGHMVESHMLDSARTARTVRIRGDRVTSTDGPYAEAKEVLGGFNLIEARDMEEAVRIAANIPLGTDRLHRGPCGAGPRGRAPPRARQRLAGGIAGGVASWHGAAGTASEVKGRAIPCAGTSSGSATRSTHRRTMSCTMRHCSSSERSAAIGSRHRPTRAPSTPRSGTSPKPRAHCFAGFTCTLPDGHVHAGAGS